MAAPTPRLCAQQPHAPPDSALTFLLPCEEKLCECCWRLPPLRSSCGFQTSPLSLPTDLVGEMLEFSRIPLCTISSVHVRRRLHRYSSVSLSTTSKRVSVSTALMRCTTWKGEEQLSRNPGTSQLWQELDHQLPHTLLQLRSCCRVQVCCHFQTSVMGEKGRVRLWGTPRMECLVPAAPGEDGDGSFYSMSCNPHDSSAQGSCTDHPGSPALLRQELSEAASLTPEHQKPSCLVLPLRGTTQSVPPSKQSCTPSFPLSGASSSHHTQGRVESRGAQGGTEHPCMHSVAGLPLLGARHCTGVPATPRPRWIYERNNPICAFIPSPC